MSTFVKDLMAEVKAKNPAEPEFHQAVQEVAESLALVLEQRPEYRTREDPRADHRARARPHVPRALAGRPGERPGSTAASGSR